jgi:hypothetical protein
MSPATIEDLACGMDDMGDFMHEVPPPFPTVARAVGIPAPRPSKLYTTNGLVTAHSPGFSIPSREQGQAYVHKSAAIRRGGR